MSVTRERYNDRDKKCTSLSKLGVLLGYFLHSKCLLFISFCLFVYLMLCLFGSCTDSSGSKIQVRERY